MSLIYISEKNYFLCELNLIVFDIKQDIIDKSKIKHNIYFNEHKMCNL